jgi:hypothetical protein
MARKSNGKTARVKKHASDLQLLARAKRALRNRSIRNAPRDLIMSLVDLAKAIIKGELSMSSTQLKAVRRHKKNFRKVVKPKVSVKTLKKTFQTGGFLPALLGPALKLIGPLVVPLVGGLLGGGQR